MPFPGHIGIAGPMGSGKSTAARMIAEILHDYKLVMNIPFAYRLKKQAEALGWDGNKMNEKGRKLLQMLGTQVGRECIDEDIWVCNWVEEGIEATKHIITPDCESNHGGCLVIIADDVRFPNEAEAIKSRGGKILFLTDRHLGSLPHACSHHKSETSLFAGPDDYIIKNEGDLDDLKAAIAEFVTKMINENGL